MVGASALLLIPSPSAMSSAPATYLASSRMLPGLAIGHGAETRNDRCREAHSRRLRTGCGRLLSLRAYGLVTSTLFGATTPPIMMPGRFERFSRVSRQAIRRKFPRLVVGDHAVDGLAIESVCAVESPARVTLYLHGGAFSMAVKLSVCSPVSTRR